VKDSQTRSNELMSIIFFAFILLFTFGFIFSDQAKSFFVRMNYYTMLPIARVLGAESDAAITIQNIRRIKTIKSISWDDVWEITSVTGSYMRWLVIFPCFFWVYFFLYRKDCSIHYARKIGLKDLMERNARLFYATRPVIGENLLDKKTYEGPWAPARSPLEFALDHGILEIEGKSREELKSYIYSIYKKRRIMGDALCGDFIKCAFNEEIARSVFDNQLGALLVDREESPKCVGDILRYIFKMGPHKRALLLVFLCHYIAEDNLKDVGTQFLEQFADSYYIEKLKKEKKKKEWTVQALNIHGVDEKIIEIVKKYDFEKIVIPFYFHAHENVVLISIFNYVKTIISSDFIWLKPVDRGLWYVLNSVGRKTPFAEAAGAFSHYNMERALRRPLINPDVDAAVNALKDALQKEGWLDITKEGGGNYGSK
jgi:intracellular multiplication protein IcmP